MATLEKEEGNDLGSDPGPDTGIIQVVFKYNLPLFFCFEQLSNIMLVKKYMRGYS